jgi:hypothetical protein
VEKPVCDHETAGLAVVSVLQRFLDLPVELFPIP